MNCPTTTRNEYEARCDNPPEPKPQPSVKIPPRSKEQEIESIKRTLYNAIDKLDKLTAK